MPAQLSAGLPSSRGPLPGSPSPLRHPRTEPGHLTCEATGLARAHGGDQRQQRQHKGPEHGRAVAVALASPERQHKGAWATWTQRKGPSLPCAADSGSGFRGCARRERSLMPARKHPPLPQQCPSGHLHVTAHSPSRQMASFRKGEYPTARLHLWVPSRCYAENTFQTRI